MTIPFEVDAQVLEDGIHVLGVSGELDEATADGLRVPLQGAIDAGATTAVIDLTECEFIDSTGLGVIVHAWRELDSRDGGRPGLALCCPDPEIRRLLELTGIADQIALHNTREEALAALRG